MSSSEDEDRMDTEFEILEFTQKKRQVGATWKYVILDSELREHEKSIHEIHAVAEKDPETWKQFVEWIGPSDYKAIFGKQLPKKKEEPLPAKRRRNQVIK